MTRDILLHQYRDIENRKYLRITVVSSLAKFEKSDLHCKVYYIHEVSRLESTYHTFYFEVKRSSRSSALTNLPFSACLYTSFACHITFLFINIQVFNSFVTQINAR